jgi:3-oxoacyl-[acyl-carrier-protein] synthase II
MLMSTEREVVITAMGIVSPIGIGKDRFWDSLCSGRSGVRRLELFAACGRPPIGADVSDFDPKQYVKPRKALKVMSRDIQLGFTAADLACADAGLKEHPLDPERSGVVFGADMIACEIDELGAPYRACIHEGNFQMSDWGGRALAELFPLWMLKYLPNMPACHIGIVHDLRGPTNALILGEVSSLASVAEAARVIRRGQADAMVAGGVGARVQPMIWTHEQALEFSQRADNPAAACRPFDAQRDGMLNGEGAGAFVLETRASAQARGAKVLARVVATASAFEPRPKGHPLEGTAIRRAIREALRQAGLKPSEVGHVNAHGMSTRHDDRIEAQAIRAELGDVPVTAPKSFFGYLGAGSGAVELAASLLALEHGQIPPTLNYEHPDPECPVNVVHGRPLATTARTALVLNHSRLGQSVAVVLAAD